MGDTVSILMFDAAYPPPVTGGKEKQAHLLARELVRKGYRVQSFSYKHNGNKSQSFEGVWVTRVPGGLIAVPLLLMYLLLNRFRFRILHVHTPSRIGKIVSALGFFLGYKLVFKFPNERMLESKSALTRFGWNMLFRVAHLLVVLEEDTRKKLLNNGVDESKIFYVSNGIEVPEQVEFQRGVSNKFRIVFVGRLMPQKRCRDLIRACALLDKEKIDWHLDIIGDGPLRSELENQVYKLELGPRVNFTGYQDDVRGFLQQMDILVLPSEKEGMSNVILEAMSLGLPVLASDVGSARNQLGDMGQEFLFGPGDINSMAEKIAFQAQNRDQRLEYGQYLYTRCKALFSIDAVAESYSQMYRNILQ